MNTQIRPLKLLEHFLFELSVCWPIIFIQATIYFRAAEGHYDSCFNLSQPCYIIVGFKLWAVLCLGFPSAEIGVPPVSSLLSWVPVQHKACWGTHLPVSAFSVLGLQVCPVPTDSWFKYLLHKKSPNSECWFILVVGLELSLPVMFSLSQDQKNTLPSSNITLEK